MFMVKSLMSGSGNPQLYRPHDVFTAMGRCWVLEDEFSYPINPNLRNSAYVHNTMRQEWAWLFREQEMFYDELMPRDTIEELHKALNRIREENNRMKIRLNRYRTQVEIRESVEGGWYEHAQFMQSLLADPIYQSDVEMSDEE
ncbi:hypothetical protein SO802_023245 [Lithocarpus litseifolius]|uniref:Uncharacterized protein n=1 Tax=Lithocarpus litseifolius TaxID=425828 RepID=A0AAW2C8A3_9ROSI